MRVKKDVVPRRIIIKKKLWLREALAFATGVTEMLSVMIHSTVNWYN